MILCRIFTSILISKAGLCFPFCPAIVVTSWCVLALQSDFGDISSSPVPWASLYSRGTICSSKVGRTAQVLRSSAARFLVSHAPSFPLSLSLPQSSQVHTCQLSAPEPAPENHPLLLLVRFHTELLRAIWSAIQLKELHLGSMLMNHFVPRER